MAGQAAKQTMAAGLAPKISPVVYYPLQQTVADAIVAHGVGVHTGTQVQLVIRPAPPNTGFVFRRVDLPGVPTIPACVESVVRSQLATSLATEAGEITTVEHLLSALVGVGVDNAYLEVDSFEVPIFDGSAAPIVNLIHNTGLVFQPAPKQRLLVTRTVRAGTEDHWIRVDPCPALIIDYTLAYDHPIIGHQHYVYIHSPHRYHAEISHARTFCLFEDVEKMHALNLAQGGSLQNTVVVTDQGIANPEGTRYENEFVRHKILDIIGDFALLGTNLVGRITAHRSGHKTNREAVALLLQDGATFLEELVAPVLEGELTAALEA